MSQRKKGITWTKNIYIQLLKQMEKCCQKVQTHVCPFTWGEQGFGSNKTQALHLNLYIFLALPLQRKYN